jgi:hypothetical protein
MQNFVRNEDPFVVAEINIKKLVTFYLQPTDGISKLDMLQEIDVASNVAYMRGYISEEFYTEVCTYLGLTPQYDEEKHLPGTEYDLSESARLGFYHDLLGKDEE